MTLSSLYSPDLLALEEATSEVALSPKSLVPHPEDSRTLDPNDTRIVTTLVKKAGSAGSQNTRSTCHPKFVLEVDKNCGQHITKESLRLAFSCSIAGA